MKYKKSILEMANGAIMEKLNVELAKVLKNINDKNTEPTKPRKIKIELTFKPDVERKTVSVQATTKVDLQPVNPTIINLFNMSEVDKETKQIKNSLVEMTTGLPGQIDIYGNVVEPEALLVIDVKD